MDVSAPRPKRPRLALDETASSPAAPHATKPVELASAEALSELPADSACQDSPSVDASVGVAAEEVGDASYYQLGGPLLGAGAFGKVELITHGRTGKAFACKLLPSNDTTLSEAIGEQFIMEAAGVHEHIIGFVDFFELPVRAPTARRARACSPATHHTKKGGAYHSPPPSPRRMHTRS